MHEHREECLQAAFRGWRQETIPQPSVRNSATARHVADVPVIEEHHAVCNEPPAPCEALVERPAQVAVLYLVSGRMWAYAGKEKWFLEPGTLLVWPTRHAVSLETVEPLHRYTFLFQEQEIAACLPQPADLRCVVIQGSSPLGALVGGFFEGLTRQIGALPENFGSSAASMARAVVTRALAAVPASRSETSADLVLERVLAHVERKLHDPALSPAILAKAQGISVRYLHQVFSRRGLRVATLIRQRRLSNCRLELAKASPTITITHIAMKWGFNDSSHFSRLFSATYGIAPASYRRQCRVANTNSASNET
jgi:AraC-like DNA-binding protein